MVDIDVALKSMPCRIHLLAVRTGQGGCIFTDLHVNAMLNHQKCHLTNDVTPMCSFETGTTKLTRIGFNAGLKKSCIEWLMLSKFPIMFHLPVLQKPSGGGTKGVAQCTSRIEVC